MKRDKNLDNVRKEKILNVKKNINKMKVLFIVVISKFLYAWF